MALRIFLVFFLKNLFFIILEIWSNFISFQTYDNGVSSRQNNTKWTLSTSLRFQPSFQIYQNYSRYLCCVRRKSYYRKNCTEIIFILEVGELRPHRHRVLADWFSSMRTNWTKDPANPLENCPSRLDALMIPSPVNFNRFVKIIDE